MAMKGGLETRNYPKPVSEVFPAVLEVLDGLDMKVTAKDENAGTISVSTGLTFTSFGNNISIGVKLEGEGTSVTIEAKTKGIALADWGRGSREINLIFKKTEEKLGVAPKEEEPHGTGCPSCGKPVSSGDAFCQGCGAKL